MRVLQLHTRYRQPGGEDAVVEADASMLAAAGIEVVRHEAANPEGALAGLAGLVTAPHNLRAARAVSRVVRRAQPDVAHIHNTWFAMTPAVVDALAAARVPVVMTVHNYRLTCANSYLFRDGRPCEDCIGATPLHAVQHACYRGSRLQSLPAAATIALARRRGTWARGVDRFLALTDFARERLVRAGLPAARVGVRANAVDDPGPRAGAPSASRSVLFVGRLSAEKGLAVVLEAWRRRPPPDLELLVLGDGPERAALQADSPPGVRFLGRVQPADVRRHMLSARALLFPSIWYEGQPMTMLEAFACALPVRASDLGGGGETVAPLGAQALVAPADPDAWAHALTSLARADRDGGLDAEASRARARYEEAHTPARALSSLLEAYETVGVRA